MPNRCHLLLTDEQINCLAEPVTELPVYCSAGREHRKGYNLELLLLMFCQWRRKRNERGKNTQWIPSKIREKGMWTGSSKMIPTPLKPQPFSSICLSFSLQDMFWILRTSAGHDLKIMDLILFYRKKLKAQRGKVAPQKLHSTFQHHSPKSWKVPIASWMNLLPLWVCSVSIPGLAERICQLSACLSN